MEANSKPPKVFISYAWEDDIKTWVLDFATRLRSDGVNAILDQWETVPGDQLTEFMEKSVRESDFVVFVCTPTYKRKSDRRKGGVGYEGSIITGEVFAKNNHRKFIPVLRKGKWASAAPSWATSKLFIDLRSDPYNEMYYQQLLNTLFRKSSTAPPVWDDTLREKAKRKAEEKVAREKEQQEAAEKAVREREDLEKVKKAEQEELERELAEKEAREKEEREAAERVAQEKAKSEATEKAKREKAERRAAQIRGLKEFFSNSFTSFKLAISKAKPLLRIAGIIGIILVLLWGGSWAAPQVLALFPTPTASVTPRPTNTTAPSSSPIPFTKTVEPSQTPTEVFTPIETPTKTFTSTPILDIGSTMTSDKDGMIMVYVPEGSFTMGTDNRYAHEGPAHNVYLDSFWIDQTEVTNGQYALCMQAGACDSPLYTGGYSDYFLEMDFSSYPIVRVNWIDARSYCQWAGRRLPTEAEWEKAARGTDGRIYPWGNELPTCSLANTANCGPLGNTPIYSLLPVGSYSSASNPYSTFDMIGNVWEWVADWYDETYYANSPERNPDGPLTGEYRILRGGSSSQTASAVSRNWTDPDNYFSPGSSNYGYIGFRCARDANP